MITKTTGAALAYLSTVGYCTGPPPLRIATFNAANGADAQYRTPDMMRQQAEFLASINPDILALQEVDYMTNRVGGADVASAITSLLPAGGTLIHGLAQQSDDGSGGWWGEALWISPLHTVTWTQNQPLPNDGSEFWPPYPPAQRVLIQAKVNAADGRTFSVITSHLTAYGSHPAQLRAEQFQFISSLNPDVFAADTNATTDESHNNLPEMNCASCIADRPDVVDQIWTRNPPTGGLVSTDGVSDHEFAAVGIY